jgi:hypothetical protein
MAQVGEWAGAWVAEQEGWADQPGDVRIKPWG